MYFTCEIVLKPYLKCQNMKKVCVTNLQKIDSSRYDTFGETTSSRHRSDFLSVDMFLFSSVVNNRKRLSCNVVLSLYQSNISL